MHGRMRQLYAMMDKTILDKLDPRTTEVVNQLLHDGWYGDLASLLEAAERLANG